MTSVLSNIQEAYKGFFTQLQEVGAPIQRVFSDEYSEEDTIHVSSIGLKVLGTFSLAFVALITLHTLYRRSFSISKFVFSGLFFVIGHDSLKAGDNLYKRCVKQKPSYEGALAHGLHEKGKDELAKVQQVRKQDGIWAAFKQGLSSTKDLAKSGVKAIAGDEQENEKLLGRGISKIAFEGTIVLKPIFDWALSQEIEEQE